MTAFILKSVALLTMIIDHTGYMLQGIGYGDSAMFLRLIGRSAFPLYAFLIGEGCRFTSNRIKYILRLLLFAFISEPAFDLFVANIGRNAMMPLLFFDFSYQNVFFTLCLGAVVLCVYYTIKQRTGQMAALIAGLFLGVGAAFAANTIEADYGLYGVALIVLPVLVREQMGSAFTKSCVPIAVMAVILYYTNFRYPMSVFLAALPCLALIVLYNGKKGASLKWLFYAAYPVHLLILFAVWLAFLRPEAFLL